MGSPTIAPREARFPRGSRQRYTVVGVRNNYLCSLSWRDYNMPGTQGWRVDGRHASVGLIVEGRHAR